MLISATTIWLLMYSLNGEPYIPYPKSREFYLESECKAAMNMLNTQSRVIKKLKIKLECQSLIEIEGHEDSA